MKHKVYTSLLWPTETHKYFTLDEKAVEDLDLTDVFRQHEDLITDWLATTIRQMPIEEGTIKFRQEILRDFDRNSQLMTRFMTVAQEFFETRNMIKFAFERDHTLYNVLKRVEDSEVILKGLTELKNALNEATVTSQGLTRFLELIEELMDSELFQAYEKDLKSIRSKSTIRSMKLGLNVDQDMNPVEAIVLTLEEEPFRYTRPMKRVTRILEYGISEIKKVPRRIFAPETVIPKENLNALEKIISPAMGQLLKFIDTFNDALLEVFEPLKDELTYYNLAIHMKNSLVAMGHPVIQASYHMEHDHYIKGLYNANLAYHLQETGDAMVYNDIEWQDKHIHVLTGANRGGKTTFTQAIGQINWFSSLGFFVAASSANLPVLDGLFIHFPIEEKETVLYGRLGEECQRFSSFFGKMTSKSLLLMNESFSGTSHSESLTIAEAALRATAKIGLMGLFNTHLHELAGNIEQLNEAVKNDNFSFSNLVSGSKDNHQSFVIRPGEPLGKSYAHDIAVKYGISFEQLMKGME